MKYKKTKENLHKLQNNKQGGKEVQASKILITF